jgi:putative ABC transport system permease protein
LITGKNVSLFQAEYGMHVSDDGAFFNASLDIAKAGRVGTTTIAAAAISAFSIILLIVSMIVIGFRIINTIEEGMTLIGVQKAVGYRSVQIISSIALQFGITALIGGVMGVAISQALIPLLMEVWKPVLGLNWMPRFDTGLAAISVSAVLVTSLAVSVITARTINTLHPLIALRGGITAHSWSRNHLPLDTVPGPLSLLLALKQVLQNKKRTAGISLIVAALTLASVVGITLNYNLNERRVEFARSIFGEIPHIDILFMLNKGNNGESFKERMLKRPEVRKVFGYTGNRPISLDVNGTTAVIIIAEDCSLMESKMMIDGRYPKHDNEIALGTFVLQAVDKKIGQTVIVGNSENKREYLITGIVQTTERNGFNGLMNVGGMRLLRPDFDFRDYAVYLNEGVTPRTFIESVQTAEGAIFEEVIEEQKQVNNLLDSISVIFAAVTAMIGTATVFVIILVLYMVIKTTILRRRRELGIQKALGFTTLQLMNQIALNMTPVIFLGVTFGAIVGYANVNAILLILFRGMGVAKLQLAVPVGQTVVVSIALVILAYMVSLLIAWRIRKISAYALVTE